MSVINTDESSEYKKSLQNIDIVLEHDEYNDIDIKEQSLVLSFEENPDYNYIDDSDSLQGGIQSHHAALISNSFPSLGDKAQSYFAYEKMQMYVHGGDPVMPDNCSWCQQDSSLINLLFRIGKDNNNYYEFHQPIFSGWNEKNHIDVNIDELTQLKIPTIDSPAEKLNDVGVDGCNSALEDGFGGCLDSLSFNYYCINQDSLPLELISNFINLDKCSECNNTISQCDPNNDNWDDINDNDIWDLGEGTEGNNKFDDSEPAIEDINGDGIFTPHPTYDYDNEYYIWVNTEEISDVCNFCTTLHIKGTPSINNIQNIVIGVINNSEERIFGKVLVNELRMSKVKKSKGRTYSVSGSLDFADLMNISGSYKKKDSDFHKLQQRLGSGNSDETSSATIRLNPNIVLPTKWGIKTPITIGYNKSILTPKYIPGSDIL